MGLMGSEQLHLTSGRVKDRENKHRFCKWFNLTNGYWNFLSHIKFYKADECFKRAIQVEPLDAEVLGRCADLCIVRKDLWGAEEIYQQAMSSGMLIHIYIYCYSVLKNIETVDTFCMRRSLELLFHLISKNYMIEI